jgi:uncharacterized protein (DUF427 family)
MQRIEPQKGQESVWDYPRPPKLEPVSQRLRVVFNGITIADSERGYRVLETSSPPTYYFPRDDVQTRYLTSSQSRSVCEWKGGAVYWNVEVDGKRSEDAGWSYPDPVDRFTSIKDYIAFYPGRVDACYVGDEQAQPQDGRFYGGWITANIVGPFKGAPGSEHW